MINLVLYMIYQWTVSIVLAAMMFLIVFGLGEFVSTLLGTGQDKWNLIVTTLVSFFIFGLVIFLTCPLNGNE